MNLKEMIDGFFITRRRRLAETTRTNYQYAFRRLCAFFGDDRDFASITHLDIHRYIEHLESDGLSERSVFDNIAICSALWTFAEKEFKFPHVVRKVEKPEYTDKQIIPFTENELKSILAAAEWTKSWNVTKTKVVRARRSTWRRDIALIMLLVDTGLRITEACNLTLSDYDKDSGRLIVRKGKGNKERAVFMGDAAQRVLWRYLISRDKLKPSDPLFITRHGKPLHRTYVLHLFYRVGSNANVDNVHPHRFRHTFAIQFLRNGGNVFELQRILGHVDLETVKIYLNLAQVDIERAQRANSPADNWRL